MALRVLLCLLVLASAPASDPLSTNFSINLAAPRTDFPHAWEECVGSGHASLALRADWRAHLSRCRKELGFKRTRFHGLLDDDMSISLGPGRNSYVNLDSVIDFHSSIGMVPLFELSFMPGWLATNTSATTCHYKGITSPPKNYSQWGEVIEQLAVHLLSRYGEDKCKEFMFEVWNEPNGGNNPDSGFWTGWPKQQTYFELYKHTANALSSVSEEFQVGGPSTAGCPGWITDLHAFVTNSTPPIKLDFFTCHNYGGGSNNSDVGSLDFIKSFQTAKQLAGDLPLIVTEWSSSWSFNAGFHDDPGSAAFITAAIAQADGATDMMSYWTFSDVFEEGGMLPSAFHGGFGLLTVYGTPKPAYRAFQLLHEAGDQRVPVVTEAQHECGDGGVLATVVNGSSINLFLYNHQISGDSGHSCTLNVGVEGVKDLTTDSLATRIDQAHSNPQASFLAMGSPPSPSDEQLQALEQASALVWSPLLDTTGVVVQGSTVSVQVPPHGLCVLRIPL